MLKFAGPSSRASTSRRVLVVDDYDESAHVVGVLISIVGHDSRIACNGRDALKISEEFKPEVVILDILLPDMNGFEVAGLLRSKNRAIYLAAFTGANDIANTRRSGFHEHLLKPVDLAGIRGCLLRAEKWLVGSRS